MTGGVYEIVHTATGRRYIGSAGSFARRWAEHRADLRRGDHNNPLLQRAWNKYGAAAFIFRPLLICAPRDLRDYEQRCLDGLKPEYNIATCALAPFAGRKHTAESLAKISAGNKGKIISPEQREQSAAAHRGRVLTPEHREKVRQSLLGNTAQK